MTKYFQDSGLLLGFVSYSYHIDGHKLYDDVFEKQFFKKYKDGINKYSIKPLSQYMYKPKGYRLFGNYGLAILSLIDDFAFCDRIFHANHGYGEESEESKIPQYRYYSRVVTGVTSHQEKDYLEKKALSTFLKEEKKFPFIGIIKLKINNNILFGNGIEATEQIKNIINDLSERIKQNHPFDSIALDCFDNDELCITSFSNDISTINTFFSQIRNLTYNSLYPTEEGNGKEHRHLFLSSITNIGYDISYEFMPNVEDCITKNKSFIPVADITNVKIKVIWETRVGHQNMFKEYLSACFPCCKIMEYSLTGGNAISFQLPLHKIHYLENQCMEKTLEHHVKRIKIVLNWGNNSNYELDESKDLEMRRSSGSFSHLAFTPPDLNRIRNLLNECRVSKILRERLLKIYGLFNESICDILHSGYFFELRESLENIENILRNFTKDTNIKIGDIDHCLSELITSIEEGYYNRFHQREMRDTNLEYNGGIQQHLTSYDFTYKEILRLLSPQKTRDIEAKRSFISVSGYEKVASTRMNLRLNINQISYPELFAISVWKEACNFSHPLIRKELEQGLREPKDEEEKIYFRKYSIWSKFSEQKKSFINIRSILINESYFDYNDDTYHTISKLLDKETIEYFFIDAFSYHFGFHQNYELFYHCYWKYFLQISQHYNRKGEIDKNYFISYLLRLFMIGFRSHIDHEENQIIQMNDFFENQRFIPFDPSLSNLWLSCYRKTYKCAQTIWKELNKFYFEEVTNKEINIIESLITSNNPDLSEKDEYAKEEYDKMMVANSFIANERKIVIEQIKEKIKAGNLAILEEIDEGFDDYVICLLNAYLLATKELDEKMVDSLIIKCLPRNYKGEILLKENDKDDILKKNISNLPVDPLGGIFITNNDTRGEYFHYRTSFYRSLWNYTMLKRKM